jgi:hypothetical protein
VASGRVVPEEERGVRCHGAVDEVQRSPNDLGIDVFHVGLGRRVHARVRRQRTAISDRLLAHPAPARMLSGVIDVSRLGVQNVPRSEALMKSGILRILVVVGLLHGVEVVQDAVKLVEAVDGPRSSAYKSERRRATARRWPGQPSAQCRASVPFRGTARWGDAASRRSETRRPNPRHAGRQHFRCRN